jgi:hypothetical protein
MTPEARALVRAVRSALRPSQGDRERVLRLLLPLVGATQSVGLAHALTAATTTLAKVSAALVAVGVAGGGLFLAARPKAPVIEVAKTALAQPAPVWPSAPPSASPVTSQNEQAPQAKPSEKPVPVLRRRTDELAREVAILSRAGGELHAGQPEAALKTLEEHQRNFPHGVLTQERLAARARALCALGRTMEAEVELGRLAQKSPNSPHEARARQACGLVSGGD